MWECPTIQNDLAPLPNPGGLVARCAARKAHHLQRLPHRSARGVARQRMARHGQTRSYVPVQRESIAQQAEK